MNTIIFHELGVFPKNLKYTKTGTHRIKKEDNLVKALLFLPAKLVDQVSGLILGFTSYNAWLDHEGYGIF